MGTEKNPPELYPGQIEVFRLGYEELQTLSSPVRAEVFWSISAIEPKSATDLARELGKPPQTIRFHLNTLLERAMILEVGQRKRHARTEQLLVRKGRFTLDLGASGDEAYNRVRVRTIRLEAAKNVREAAHFYGWLEHDPSAYVFNLYRKYHLRLRPERAKELRDRIQALLLEAQADQASEDEGGVMVNVVATMRPTLFQVRKWAEEAGVDWQTLSRDGSGETPKDEE